MVLDGTKFTKPLLEGRSVTCHKIKIRGNKNHTYVLHIAANPLST